MTAQQILKELKPLGSEGYRKILSRHGIPEPMYGVKVEELKKILKREKKNYQLALDLYDTGVYDAMYLAGLMADETKMTRKDLQGWLDRSTCGAIRAFVVAGVTADSAHGWELALKWIDAKDEATVETGWSTLSGVVAVKADADLDIAALKMLLLRVEKSIHQAPNRARYNMNGFVISVGSYVKELTELAEQTGKKIGEVTVDMGETACEVPFAPEYIEKVRKRGNIGKKRKTTRC